MRIAIDLDNTLVRTNETWINKVSKELNYNFTVDDHVSYDFENYPEDFAKRSEELLQDPNFVETIPPFENVLDKLVKWNNNGHNLDIITARPPNMEEMTIRYVKKEFPVIKNIMILGWRNNKKEFLKNYDVFIDDNNVCIEAALEINVPLVYMISNYTTRYNWSYIEKYRRNGAKIVNSILDINI